MKKVLKYILLSVTGLTALLLISVSVLLYSLNTGWGRGKVVSLINKNSPVDIGLTGFRLDILGGTLEFSGLEIFDADQLKIGGIDLFRAGIQYKPLFSNKFIIDSLVVSGINIDISSEQIHEFQHTRAEKKERDRADGVPDLIISRLEVRDVNFSYTDNEKNSLYGLKTKKITASADLVKTIYLLDMEGIGVSVSNENFDKVISSENISVSVEGDNAVFGKTKIITEGLELEIAGAVSNMFDVPFFDIKFSALAETSKLFDKHEILSKDRGRFTLRGSFQGEAEDPVFDLSIRHPKGVVYAQEITKLDLTAKYQKKLLTLETRLEKGADETFLIDGSIDLTSVLPEGLLSSEPVIENTNYDLRIIAENFSLKNIPGMPEVLFDFDLSLNGTGVRPDQITAEIILNTDLSPFSFDSFELKEAAELFAILDWDKGRFGAEIDLRAGGMSWDKYEVTSLVLKGGGDDSGIVRIDELTVITEDSQLIIKGSSEMFGSDLKILIDPSFDAVLNAKRIDTSYFLPDIKTQLDLNAEVKGKLSNFSGIYELNADGFEYSGVIIEGVTLDGRIGGNEIFVDHLGIRTGGSEIYLSGKITDYKKFDAVIRAEDIIAAEVYAGVEDIAKFKTDISISAGGSFSNPDVEGNIRIKDIDLPEFDISDINMEIRLKDMVADLKIHYDFLIDVNADLRKKTYKAEVTFDEWDYSDLIPGNSDRYFEGSINGRVSSAGDYSDVQNYRITADLDSVVFTADKRKIVHGSVFKAKFSGGLLEADEIKLTLLDDGFLNIEGMLELEKEIEMGINLSVPLRSLSFLIPELSGTEGYVDGKIALSGQLSSPVFEGKLDLKDVGIVLPVTEQKLSGLNGKIGFKKDRISLEGISGRVERGTVGLDGSIGLNGTQVTSISAAFRANSLPVSYPDHLEGLVNAEINYSGDLKKGSLRGSVLILDALYYKDYDLFGAFMGAGSSRIVKTETEKDALPDISLDLTLQSRRTIVMDNNLGFLELKPDLQIGGNISSPLISGRARIEKDGYLMFQKRSFVINRGVLDFEPVYGVMPIADVESETKAGNHRVFLSISESLSNPRFSLTSVPPESDADILSILLFGRKTSELASGGDEVSREKMIADWLSGAYSEDIAKRTGLDYIEFSVSDDFSAKEPSGFGLTVGKKISDRLILKYSLTNTGTGMLQKGIADYQLFENIIFSGFQATDGTFGAETQFRVEFR